ncbi:Mediator of RNA polymerase II transcription subunit 12 [Bienertia sinuspersici]
MKGDTAGTVALPTACACTEAEVGGLLRAEAVADEEDDAGVDVAERTKISRSGAYTSSSNHDNTENEDVQILDERSTSQKAAKLARKKGGKKTSSQMVDDKWSKFEDLASKRLDLMQEHVRQTDFEILLKDTSKMDEGTSKSHNQICSIIKAKYGLE